MDEPYLKLCVVKEALIYSRGRAGAFALAGQGARSVVGLSSMSEEQRRRTGACNGGMAGPSPEREPSTAHPIGISSTRAHLGRLASAPSWIETRSARIGQGFLNGRRLDYELDSNG